MTPRPLIKWKSFWLGILVLGFSGWAWVQSMGRATYYAPVDGRLEFAHETGNVGLDLASHVVWQGVVHYRTSTQNPFFPKLVQVRADDVTVSYRAAHWFLMLFFAVPWLGLLFWRVRKQRKSNA